MGKNPPRNLGYILASSLFARINLNVAFRITYPFLPAISRGLRVSFQTGSLLVTVRYLAGLSSLFFGPLADRIGHKRMMFLGIVLLGTGTFLIPVAPGFKFAILAFGIIGMAKAAYDPAMQAYISSRIPYHFRARILGITELAWAGGWFVGVPLSGYLMEQFGWQSPFILMAAATLPSLILIAHLPDAIQPGRDSTWMMGSTISLVRVPRVSAALIMSFLIVFAVEQFFVVYGAWMEHAFALRAAALGEVSAVVGVSEILGELGVTLYTDRIGKRLSLMVGIVSSGLFFFLVPILNQSLWLTLLGLAFLFISIEFTIVSSYPFISELMPEQRSTLMALTFTSSTLGHILGAITGPRLWEATENLLIHGIVSVLALTGAFLSIAFLTFEGPVSSTRHDPGRDRIGKITPRQGH